MSTGMTKAVWILTARQRSVPLKNRIAFLVYVDGTQASARGVCHSVDITTATPPVHRYRPHEPALCHPECRPVRRHRGFRDIDEACRPHGCQNTRRMSGSMTRRTAFHTPHAGYPVLNYGYIDVLNRYVRFVGKPFTRDFVWTGPPASFYAEYLDILFKAQGLSSTDAGKIRPGPHRGNPQSRAPSASSTTISSWMHSRVDPDLCRAISWLSSRGVQKRTSAL